MSCRYHYLQFLIFLESFWVRLSSRPSAGLSSLTTTTPSLPCFLLIVALSFSHRPLKVHHSEFSRFSISPTLCNMSAIKYFRLYHSYLRVPLGCGLAFFIFTFPFHLFSMQILGYEIHKMAISYQFNSSSQSYSGNKEELNPHGPEASSAFQSSAHHEAQRR